MTTFRRILTAAILGAFLGLSFSGVSLLVIACAFTSFPALVAGFVLVMVSMVVLSLETF